MQQPDDNLNRLINAFERLEVRVGEIDDRQDFIEERQDRMVDDVDHNIAFILRRVNNFIEEVRNCVAGAPAPAVVNQPGAPAPFVNQPGAFPRPAGASGKNGFMQFLIARMPGLDGQQREDLWRTTSEIMRLRINNMRELDGVANVAWRDLDHGLKELMKRNAFADLQAQLPDLAATIQQCFNLWPLALCAQAK